MSECVSNHPFNPTAIFVVYPGHVKSKNDGQVHFIPAERLANLYGLKRSEWVVFNKDQPADFYTGLFHLFPSYDGDYTLDHIPRHIREKRCQHHCKTVSVK